MISPQYLDRLYGLTTLAGPIEPIWRDLISAHALGENPRHILLLLARSALTIAAREATVPFAHLLIQMRDLHRDKNAGYAGDNPDPWVNFRECNAFRISTVDGALTRLCDKMARYRVISADPGLERVGERMADTLTDLGSYAIIITCLLDEPGGVNQWRRAYQAT